jgi:hypothetical protein
MKVLTNYKDLEGKTIAFAHLAQFADQITLATTDGGVLMANFEGMDVDDMEIRIFNKHSVISVIQRNTYLREELDKLEIFNLEEWKNEQEKQRRLEEEKRKKAQEERDRKEYERLKVKFENN